MKLDDQRLWEMGDSPSALAVAQGDEAYPASLGEGGLAWITPPLDPRPDLGDALAIDFLYAQFYAFTQVDPITEREIPTPSTRDLVLWFHIRGAFPPRCAPEGQIQREQVAYLNTVHTAALLGTAEDRTQAALRDIAFAVLSRRRIDHRAQSHAMRMSMAYVYLNMDSLLWRIAMNAPILVEPPRVPADFRERPVDIPPISLSIREDQPWVRASRIYKTTTWAAVPSKSTLLVRTWLSDLQEARVRHPDEIRQVLVRQGIDAAGDTTDDIIASLRNDVANAAARSA